MLPAEPDARATVVVIDRSLLTEADGTVEFEDLVEGQSMSETLDESTGIAKRVFELGAHQESFLNSNCNSWPQLAAHLAATSWEEITSKSGVPFEQIDQIAQRYARSRCAVFTWTMGITHHAHGVLNVQAIANLALLRGMVGRPGAGLLPIRGHSNVQGIGSVGVTPKLKEVLFDRLQTHFGVALPTSPGLDTMACMEGAAEGRLKFGLSLGGNLYGSNPDATYAQAALENLDMMVYLSTTLNTGHAFGLARETIILPVLARDEEPQPTTQESMFNLIRLSDGGPRRHVGPKSEVEVIATLASLVAAGSQHNTGLAAINWLSMRNTGRIREAIANVVPGFDNIRDIATTKQEFQITGRTIHEPRFPTTDGKAQLHTHQLPALSGNQPGELRLMTIRSEGQFNTVVYEDYDLYRGVEDRHVILIHPADIAALELDPASPVTVHGPAGIMPGVRVHPFDKIRPGNVAMYYPECNVLVSRSVDPASKTPAFKCVVITLHSELPQEIAD